MPYFFAKSQLTRRALNKTLIVIGRAMEGGGGGRNLQNIAEYVFYSCAFSRKKIAKFLKWNKFRFPIRNIPENTCRTLLWGTKTGRKENLVVFEISSNTIFFVDFNRPTKKKMRNFNGKISDFNNSKYSRTCLQNSFVGSN